MAEQPDSTTKLTQAQLVELVLELLPRQGEWGEGDYLWLTDAPNQLIELTDGYIEVLPWPTDRHQTLAGTLLSSLNAFIAPRGGVVRFALLRLRLREGVFREPDLLLLRDARDPRRANRYWHGADFVAEIVSPDNPARELIEKRRDYAEARIPEYWIVNPLDETITVLRLHEAAYVEHGVFGRVSRATSALLPGFGVEVAAIFDVA